MPFSRARVVLGLLSVMAVVACADQAVDSSSPAVPDHLLQPALDIVDGANGNGNEHFFWLKPITGADHKDFDGVADGTLKPSVVICPRDVGNADGCATGPALATFTRDDGPDPDRIQVDDKDQYFVQWRMNSHRPDRDGVYRIRVLIQGEEFGHVDVVTLRQRDIRAFVSDPAGDVIPISDNGAFKIAFRLEEGAVEAVFCASDPDSEECDADQEVAGDGQPTTVQVSHGDDDDEIIAVVKVPDAVFTDVSGTPIPTVVVTAQVKLAPPSNDLLTNDLQELPYFVAINTVPEDVYIDPNGPGVQVVICQDAAVLGARGIIDAFTPQLILYKVGDNNVTRRLVSTFGAPECETAAHASLPSGPMGLLQRGTRKVLDLVGPTPVSARRRLHGGLNTTVTRDVSLDAAFSVFGAALGPNAAQTQAVLPASGLVGQPVNLTVDVRNALGEHFAFGGDTVKVVVTGANAGASVAVVDNGNGFYSVTYTPTAPGVDTIAVALTRSDGWVLGAISGSPFPLTIDPVSLTVTTTADSGPGSLRASMLASNLQPGPKVIDFAIPGPGPHLISLVTPLPTITQPVTIDAETQPGYAGQPLVRVDGSTSGGSGFQVWSNNVDLRGFTITSFPGDGVFVPQGISFVTIVDSHIGTDAAGTGGLGNGVGVRVRGSSVAVADNVISGNAGVGVLVEGNAGPVTGLDVIDNRIGLTPNGMQVLPNAAGVTVYGDVASPLIRRNKISGNTGVGIDIQFSGTPVTGAVIRENVIGLDANDAAAGNGGGGVRVFNAPNTLIGGPAPWEGNVISGNTGIGVLLQGPPVVPGPRVMSNTIGLDPSGNVARGNTDDGIRIATSNVIVGSLSGTARNVISGNDSDGIESTAGTSNVTVAGNFIGTNAAGNQAVGNGFVSPVCCKTGVFLRGANHLVQNNVLSGNRFGLRIGDPGSSGNVVQFNWVGTDPTMTLDLGNSGYGIGLYGDKGGTHVRANWVRFNVQGVQLVEGTENALIGGTGPGDGNLITDNLGMGVQVGYNLAASDVHNTIRSNSIKNNGGIGIDLAGNGVTLDDGLGDADSGPNDLTNRPALVSAFNGVVPGATQVSVALFGLPNTVYLVEFFANTVCDGPGAGEGETTLLTAAAPVTDGTGYVDYTVNLPLQAAGVEITATATDPAGSTSEFSSCETVAASVPAADINVVTPDPMAPGQMVTIQGADFPGGPPVTLQQGLTSASAFVYGAGASSIVARLPSGGFAPGAATIVVGTGPTASNAYAVTLSGTPGAPQVIQLWEATANGSCGTGHVPTDGTLAIDAGQAIAVEAHGLDTSGTQVRLTQGGNTWVLSSLCAFSPGTGPVAGVVPLPSTTSPSQQAGFLIDGAGTVEVRTNVGGFFSAWSAPVNVTFDVP